MDRPPSRSFANFTKEPSAQITVKEYIALSDNDLKAKAFTFLCYALSTVIILSFTLIFLYGFGLVKLDKEIMIILTGACVAETAALATIVYKYIFTPLKDE